MKKIHVDQLPQIDSFQYEAKTTNPFEKFGASFLNAIIAFGLSVPFLILWGPSLYWRISVIILFGFYESFIFIYQQDRCFGMKVMDTYWRSHYTFRQHLMFNIFYTLSFATILIYIWFPLDLLLINLIFIQLPMSLLTGTTLHGYLSGMNTVKIVHKI
jgi:hypothetical protein